MSHVDTVPPGGGRGTAWGLGIVLFLAYMANGRLVGSYDTVPAQLLPIALIRGDGPFLDRFEKQVVVDAERHTADYATRSRGHIVSRYPLAPALVVVPLTWPQVLVLDRLRPGWDRIDADRYVPILAKTSQAILAALVGVVLFLVLRRLGLGRVAVPTALAAGLGSSLWSVGSQAPWQHGAAALMLSTAVWLLLPRPATRWRLVLAGAAAGVLVACRSIDVVFAAAITLSVAWRSRRDLAWFLPAPVLIGVALVAYNLHFFGALEGGQKALEAGHPEMHGVVGTWTGNLLEGGAGTLVSPSRGLLVYTPWIALAVILVPKIAGRIGEHALVVSVLGAVVPYGFLLAKYSCWWGGYSFGPRFWTDAIPPLAILLGYALDWAVERSRPARIGFGATIAFSVGVQLIGAFYYPSSWNHEPIDVDHAHARLWDWRDNELTRCLSMGVHPAGYRFRSSSAHASAIGISRPAGQKPRVFSVPWLARPGTDRARR
jgi:hypothetical protein